MSALKKVAVIIPFYKDTLSAYEQIALQQCQKVLSAHPVIAIKPQGLALPDAALQVAFAGVESFDDAYFASIAGYNRLMLSAEFYGRFLEYEYILIYQLDAFVFSDHLLHWCSQGIDYVGAPWMRGYPYAGMVKKVKMKIKRYWHTRFDVQHNGNPSALQFENRVGNGGFSLRRVKIFHSITQTRQSSIQKYLAHEGRHQYNEDAFWSIEVNRKGKVLNIPDHWKAAWFALENTPDYGLKITGQQLPFGCHAWDRHVDFWRPFFEQQGYHI